MQVAGDCGLNSWVQILSWINMWIFLSLLVVCFAWQELIVDELDC